MKFFFLHIYVFYKNKQTEKIAGRSVQATMSCFFCFYLLPVLWHEKYVQMIKIFQKMLLFFSGFFSILYFSHLRRTKKKKKKLDWQRANSVALSQCVWMQAAILVLKTSLSVKTTETSCWSRSRTALWDRLLPVQKKEAQVKKWLGFFFPFAWHKFTTSFFTLSLSEEWWCETTGGADCISNIN